MDRGVQLRLLRTALRWKEVKTNQSLLLAQAPSTTETEDLRVTCLVLSALWSLRGSPVHLECGPVR